MVVVGMYIRLHVQETPEFAAVKARNAELRIPFMDMIRRYPGNVLKGMGARYIDGVFFNIFGVFSINYLTQHDQDQPHRRAARRDGGGGGDDLHHPLLRPPVRPDRAGPRSTCGAR